jgi:hypothetical protein
MIVILGVSVALLIVMAIRLAELRAAFGEPRTAVNPISDVGKQTRSGLARLLEDPGTPGQAEAQRRARAAFATWVVWLAGAAILVPPLDDWLRDVYGPSLWVVAEAAVVVMVVALAAAGQEWYAHDVARARRYALGGAGSLLALIVLALQR